MTENELNFEKDGINLPYSNIMLEVTRKCNLKCVHCMRGETQNIDMSGEIIEKVFAQVEQLHHLSLTGGEPFLAPQVIEKMVDVIIENKIRLWRCTTVDNGTILNELGIRSVKALNRLGEYIYNTVWTDEEKNNPDEKLPISISISNSIYHKNDIQKAIDFYKKYANKYVDVDDQGEWETGLKDKKGNPLKNKNIKNNSKWLKKEGRAKENNIPNAKYITNAYRVEFLMNDDKNKVCVTTGIQICANGNVTIVEPVSFETMDKNNMGNVLTEPISCMIHKWNWKEPLRQSEVIEYCNNMKMIENHKIPERKRAEFALKNSYIDAKKLLLVEGHKAYPYLSKKDLDIAVYAELAIIMIDEARKIGDMTPDKDIIKIILTYETEGDYPEEGYTKDDLKNIINMIVSKNNEAMVKDRGFCGALKHLLKLSTHDANYYSNLGVNAYEK